MWRATLYPETSLRRGLMLACLALLAMASPASAQPFLALDMTGGVGGNFSPLPATLGWRFSLTQPKQVVALGYFDAGEDGFNASHDVSLWTDAGVLLATAIVTSTSTVESSTHPFGSWRFEDLMVPVDLPVGSYRIGGVDTATDSFIFAGTPTTAPDVTFDDGAKLLGIGFPDVSPDVFFGPNLMLVPGTPPPPPPTNSDSPFKASPSIWVYHSRDGDGGYDFTTVLPVGTHDLGIWATGGANPSAAGPPLCVPSEEPPTGNEVCALDIVFQLSGDGELLSFTSATYPATEDFVNETGTQLRAVLSSGGAPLLAGYPPQKIGELSLEVTGGSLLVSVTGLEGIGADGLGRSVDSHILFIPEPSEYLLLASGIGMLALLGRYRRVRTS